jgi:hypothetical protein
MDAAAEELTHDDDAPTESNDWAILHTLTRSPPSTTDIAFPPSNEAASPLASTRPTPILDVDISYLSAGEHHFDVQNPEFGGRLQLVINNGSEIALIKDHNGRIIRHALQLDISKILHCEHDVGTRMVMVKQRRKHRHDFTPRTFFIVFTSNEMCSSFVALCRRRGSTESNSYEVGSLRETFKKERDEFESLFT